MPAGAACQWMPLPPCAGMSGPRRKGWPGRSFASPPITSAVAASPRISAGPGSGIAVLHTGQNGGAADYATAAFWFRKAAERGLPDSQFNLAILSENGLGVERNLVEAYVWYSVAARQGDKEAARRRNRLKARLGVKALKIAERRARRWRALPIDATVRAPRAQSRSARGRAS